MPSLQIQATMSPAENPTTGAPAAIPNVPTDPQSAAAMLAPTESASNKGPVAPNPHQNKELGRTPGKFLLADINQSMLRGKWTIGEIELGQGAQGAVVKGSSMKGKDVAIKFIMKTLDDRAKAKVPHELAIHAKVTGHPNIVKYHFGKGPSILPAGPSRFQATTALVMDYMKGGSLAAVLAKRRKDGGGDCTEIEAKVIMYNIILAIIHLLRRGVSHGDIKPENMLCANVVTKLAKAEWNLGDFGHGVELDDAERCARRGNGTPPYWAPEVDPCEDAVAGQGYNETSDVHSAAVVVIYATTGPFEKVGNRPVLPKDLPALLAKKGMSEEGIDLMRKMLERDPKQRISAHDVLRHPWLASQVTAASLRELRHKAAPAPAPAQPRPNPKASAPAPTQTHAGSKKRARDAAEDVEVGRVADKKKAPKTKKQRTA